MIQVKHFLIAIVFPPSAQLSVPLTWQRIKQLREIEADNCIKVLIP